LGGVIEEPDEVGNYRNDGGGENVVLGEKSQADADVAGDKQYEAVRSATGMKVVAVAAIPEESKNKIGDESDGIDGGYSVDSRYP